MTARSSSWWAAAGTLLAALTVNARAESPLPELTPTLCAAAPRIDGRLDDEAWARATRVELAPVGGAAPAPRHTARVTRDNEWLYVAFDVAHPAADRAPAQVVDHDDNVQREDNVQLSLDPGTDGRVYYQFLLSKANVRADFRMTPEKGRERENWNIPWRSATSVAEQGWQAEMAIPLAPLLNGAGAPARARINLLVDCFLPTRDMQKVAVTWSRRESSWAPIIRDFNEPERFGRLGGLDGAALRTPFLPFLSGAEALPYEFNQGRFAYAVSVKLEAAGVQSGRVVLVVRDEPASGPAVERTQEVEASPGKAQPIRVVVPVENLLQRQATVRLVNPASKEVLQSLRVANVAALDLFDAFLDRSYYTGEPAAVAVCRVGLPENALAGMSLRAVEGGITVGREDALKPSMEFRIPLGGLAIGPHTLSLELTRADGGVAAHRSVTLIKRAPKPGSEWKIDRANRLLLREGQPFFPFGAMMMKILPDQEWAFRDAATLGFNTVFQWYAAGNPEKDSTTYLGHAARNGLNVILWPDEAYGQARTLTDPGKLVPEKVLAEINKSISPSSTSTKSLLVHRADLSRAQRSALFAEYFEQNLPRVSAGVKPVLDAPNLLGYNTFDEPILSHLDQQVQGRALYRTLNEIDGYRPCFVLYSSEIPPGPDATDWSDALGTDPYWIPAGENRNDVNFVARTTAMTRRRADAVRSVTYIVLMGDYWSGCFKRAVSPSEQRCQTYLALIHGARGLFYFGYPVIVQAMYDTLRDLGAQMRVLGPVCATPDLPQTVAYAPGELDPERDKFTDVQVSLRRNPAGGYVLLCANSRSWPVETTFRIGGLEEGTEVKSLFTGAAFRVKDGAFGERLEPYATRAYAFTSARPLAVPAQLRVEMKGAPGAAKEIALTRLGRVGRRNILPNPSFEEVTVPGWPDYWKQTGVPLTPEQRIGGLNPVWGVDSTNPFHGKQCVRMTARPGPGRRVTYLEMDLRDTQPKAYVFSAWLRANRDGARAALQVHNYAFTGAESTEWRLTTEWKRYTARFTSAGKPDQILSLWISLPAAPTEDTTAWVDAVQLEQGTEPTDFEP